MKSLRINIKTLIIALCCLLYGCSSSQKPYATLHFYLDNPERSHIVHRDVLELSLNKNFYAVDGDKKGLSVIANRPGFVFFIRVTQHGETLFTISNIFDEAKIDVMFFRKGFSADYQLEALKEELIQLIGAPYKEERMTNV